MPIISLNEATGQLNYAPYGGKASWLAEMDRNGLAIPPGFAISCEWLDEHLAENGLANEAADLTACVREVDPRGTIPAPLLERASALRSQIREFEIRPQLVEEVLPWLKECAPSDDGEPMNVVFRSSALSEDRLGRLAAGCYESCFVRHGGELCPNWRAALLRCWSSGFGERAMAYSRHLEPTAPPVYKMGVVVQKAIDGVVSGVCFTGAHVEGMDDSVAIIEARAGSCEEIVSGRVTPARYVVDRLTGELIDEDRGGDAAEPPLSEKDVEILAKEMATLNTFLGPEYVFDVEWTCRDTGDRRGLVFLQARPLRSRDVGCE